MFEPLREGVDFEWNEEGLMVLCASYLKRRGYCCHSGCLNCPYPKALQNKKRSKKSMENYIKAGTLEEFRLKEYKCVRIKTRHVGVFKKKEGSFYALEVNCRHQNALLFTRLPKNPVVTCPRHGWKYNLQTGECLTESWAKLRRYPLKIEEGILWVGTSPLEEGDEDAYGELEGG